MVRICRLLIPSCQRRKLHGANAAGSPLRARKFNDDVGAIRLPDEPPSPIHLAPPPPQTTLSTPISTSRPSNKHVKAAIAVVAVVVLAEMVQEEVEEEEEEEEEVE
ncbi:hypothetical protein M0804_009701 [Polistes exclamans]|nr:hypothetical protein M0804_009701 [Polistes exclamans]